MTATVATRCRHRARSQKHASAPRRFCTRPRRASRSEDLSLTLGQHYVVTVGRVGWSRFLNRDPAVAITQEPYGYAYDDPVDGSDPTGLGCGLFSPGDCVSDVTNAAGAVGHAVGTGWHDTLGQHWRGAVQGVEIGAGALAAAGCIAATAGVCGTVVGTVLTVGGIGGLTGAGVYSASSGDHTLSGYARAFGEGRAAGILSAGCALSAGTLCATVAGGFAFNSLVGAGIGGYNYLNDTCNPSFSGFANALAWGAVQSEPVPVPDSWLGIPETLF